MENKQSTSRKKSISNEEKIIREFDYDSLAGASSRAPKVPLLLEISQKGTSIQRSSHKVLVSIKPRPPAIKTLYIAEKSRFEPKKRSTKSGSRLAIGDHSSFTSHYSEDNLNKNRNITYCNKINRNIDVSIRKTPSSTSIRETSTGVSKCEISSASANVYARRSSEKCYMYTQPHLNFNIPKLETVTEHSQGDPHKTNIGTLIVTNTSSDDTITTTAKNLIHINQRIDWLERRILRQEMVFKTLEPNIQLSSSEDETGKSNENERIVPQSGSPGCSYVEYSHIPETSAFQRYLQQPAPLSPSKATTIQKEHNSEQYGRDFTLYDGITARGRRQCASVPCKRDDIPKIAAERVHKIRHKLNPVRDYRLMDTVHYLAQGEFAPRDDGIKLTPSREAVLSDIIWEDVCRTHWPNTRLGRRIAHPERYGPRSELQRLIDSLLRERVAHVERRRRRHYRIVKLNNRHENCRTVGKTGDIIVASNKNKLEGEDKEEGSDRDLGKSIMIDRREERPRRANKSQNRLTYSNVTTQRPFTREECIPGPSYAANRCSKKPSTCCYRTTSPSNRRSLNKPQEYHNPDESSGSSIITSKIRPKHPKLVVKKSTGRPKFQTREPNLEHYILLPTLVIRTPSNMKRQKKFNELYLKILNKANMKNEQAEFKFTDENKHSNSNPSKRNIGLNVNITLSESEEKLHK